MIDRNRVAIGWTKLLWAACLALALVASPAAGMFARAPEIPVARLLKNIAAYVKENPKDPQGYYLLGRVNALAFVLKSDKLRAFERKNRPLPYLDPWQGKAPAAGGLKDEQRKKHLVESITSFRKAISLKKDSGLYQLGLAYILEQGASMAHQVGLPPGEEAGEAKAEDAAGWQALIAKLGDDDAKVREAAQRQLAAAMPAAAGVLLKHVDDKDAERQTRVRRVLAGYWEERAIARYLRAHTLAIEKDRKIRHRPLRGLTSLASYEAGKAYVRLVQQRGPRKGEKQTLATVRKNLKELEGKPRGPITPIVFSLERGRRPAELLAPRAAVRFDLDGDGRPQNWPWVRPSTGILVWDPSGRGRITSGRQLFGSVTFWMFFADGFHALNVLDDDRDGRLSGGELRGLAVWFDRNTNGRSDAGEVVPIERLGVRAIETKAKGTVGRAPWHPAGLILRDGTTRPLYDWTPRPLREVK